MGAVLIWNKYSDQAEYIVRFVRLFGSFAAEFEIEMLCHQKRIAAFAELIVDFVARNRKSDDKKFMEFLPNVIEWLEMLAKQQVDIQYLQMPFYVERDIPEFASEVRRVKDEQIKYWSMFDVIKEGRPLAQIQSFVECGDLDVNGRDQGGLLLTHIAAAYDRVDVLEWLVFDKKMDLDTLDGSGRTVQQVGEATRAASSTCRWIIQVKASKIIAGFALRHHKRSMAILKQRRLDRTASAIQRVYRGFSTRRLHRGALLVRLEESQCFNAIWAPSIQMLSSRVVGGWASVRINTSDISRIDMLLAEDFGETSQKLDEALAGVILETKEDAGTVADKADGLKSDDVDENRSAEMDLLHTTSGDTLSAMNWADMFQVTSHVVKFLKQGDPKYKSFFVRRMQQLANGDRSRILQKRLKGSQTTIFESYLEQKSGFRILWTEENDTIVIWFVAKHKAVSRLMKLIDDAKSRSQRQQLPASLVSELGGGSLQPQTAPRNEILLDVGNAPLKVYDVSFNELDDVMKATWTPRMHLTAEERDVVEADGTVLLIGRSGTGKTVCICNRMEYDRQRHANDSAFTQLFVSRSSRLCKYVKEVIGVGGESNSSGNSQTFSTFRELVYQLESALPQSEVPTFVPSQHVDFYRFEREFFHEKQSVTKPSALVVWKTIRSFLKGSIEAYQHHDKVLSREYFVSGQLGKKRCRMSVEDREFVYDTFVGYQQYIKTQGLWDDCDQLVSLLGRLEVAKSADPFVFEEVRKSRIYVDEVQDYSQIECLLFFYLGGPGGLFLAGDPAQSVVLGTDFRFKDVRSVGYFVAGDGRRELIPQKPRTVNMNFWSHSGILNAAAAILDYLFTYFPSSAKELAKDHGLFQGPRPGVIRRISYEQLAALLRGKLNGVMVLTHDDSANNWKRTLDYPLVAGIREAKGLEFKSVVILDFFKELPSSVQKPWRNLILGREGTDFEARHPIVETILKLLYTAVTRSIEQLYFIETSPSVAGDASVRWLTTTNTASKPLATLSSNVHNLESMSMTCDEWLSAGIDNAEMAEGSDVALESALSLLDRAVYCFDQAQNAELAAKVRTQRQSVQFRSSLVNVSQTSASANDLAIFETKAANLLESLLTEALPVEALHLVKSVIHLLPPYSQEELRRTVLSRLNAQV